MSNQVIGFVLLRTFFLAFQSFAQDYLSILGYNPATVTLPITIEKVIYGTVNPSMTEFMAPGVIILIAYYATTALTALSLVLERKDGLLERSLVAGVNSLEFLVSHIMTQTLVLTIQEILMLITTFYIFEVPSRGPMVWVFALTFFQGKFSLCSTFLHKLTVNSFFRCGRRHVWSVHLLPVRGRGVCGHVGHGLLLPDHHVGWHLLAYSIDARLDGLTGRLPPADFARRVDALHSVSWLGRRVL